MATSNPPDPSRQIPNDVYRHVIRRQKSYLIERLGYHVSAILDKLGEEDVITDDRKIRDIEDTIGNKNRSEGVRMILDDVICQSEENYRKFLEILDLEEIDIDLEVIMKLKEEENRICTEGITMNLTKMTLADQPSTSHYDICIIFEDTDANVAEAISNYLTHLDNDVKILVFDNEAEFGKASKTDKLEIIYWKSSMQFYIVPKYGSDDEYVTWVNDSLVMQCVDNGKFHLRKVLQDKRKIKSVKLANIQEIKWFDRNTSHFDDKIRKLINSLKEKRP